MPGPTPIRKDLPRRRLVAAAVELADLSLPLDLDSHPFDTMPVGSVLIPGWAGGRDAVVYLYALPLRRRGGRPRPPGLDRLTAG
jgi:hypothetical protein